MRVAVTTENSTSARNPAIMRALEGRGLEVYNVAMTGSENDPVQYSYIHTSFMTAFLLEIGAVDLVIGGCGTGEGYAIATNMYPDVYCGLIYDPLEAWLFPQINAGKAVSLPLNKNFGWAGEENLRFVFDALFSAPSGRGYPEHRCEPQRIYREKLHEVSVATHRDSLAEIMKRLDKSIFTDCAKSDRFMELVAKTDSDSPAKKLFYELIA